MKRLLLIPVTLLIVLTMLMSVLPAAADGDPTVPTKAVVGQGNTPPKIEAKWELAGQNTTWLGVDNGKQVFLPSPAPALSTICVYAVVSDPAGVGDITAAYADVYHPNNGSLKVQIHQVLLSDFAQVTNLVNRAVATEQISSTLASQLLWMLDPTKNQAQLWWGCFQYEVHQPAGDYRVSEWAIDRGSARSIPLDNFFEIVPFSTLAIDFSAVDFGTIVAGQKKVVAGDDVFLQDDGKPTVWNKGNAGAGMTVVNTPMTGTQFGKVITNFDVQLFDQYVEYTARQVVTLVGPLMPCTPVQIEFSVLPPIDLAPDTYLGQIKLTILSPAP
ncbi:MAG: hypothetical protein M1370_00135 [Bacteroidetes bacterium]|nr:hypothetical protein [Bacteroidota bacterium]MCL5025401.1 hypothetical protein [Chloroflexota bacterium]